MHVIPRQALIPAMILAWLGGWVATQSASAEETPWRYYPSLNAASETHQAPPQVGYARENSSERAGPASTPSFRSDSRRGENEYGFPVGVDPMFRENSHPDWQQQHLERQQYERPAYNPPTTNDAPIFRSESWKPPAYQVPSYIVPNDAKPRYQIDNYAAPGYIKPSMPRPYDHALNYDVHPYVKPAYDGKPAYVAPYLDRPEYTPPVYQPDEYRNPRAVPPPWIAPPK